MTHYRGVFITHHAPFVFCDSAGNHVASMAYSFTVGGSPRMAKTIEEAHLLIDESLGPELPSA